MNKRITALVVATGLTGGAIAGVAFGTPLASSAATVSSQTGSTSSASAAAAGTTAATTSPHRSAALTATLKPLVDAGTITQSQSDAVVAALVAAGPVGGGKGGAGGPGRGGKALDAAATAIGITATELRTAVAGGQTIAQVAGSKGVDVLKVIDAMVAEAKTREAADVTSGKDTQAEADQEIVDATTRATDIVNGKTPVRPTRPAASSTTTPSSTTTTG